MIAMDVRLNARHRWPTMLTLYEAGSTDNWVLHRSIHVPRSIPNAVPFHSISFQIPFHVVQVAEEQTRLQPLTVVP